LLLEKRNTNLTSKNTLQTSCRQNLYRYAGKEKDSESGLIYFGARYYAPWLCRFVSVDPMKEKRSWLTPYNYVQNNPINLTDPDGALDTGGGDEPKGGNQQSGSGQKQNETTKKTEVHKNAYYKSDGTFLGYGTGTDNEVYIADSVTKNEDGTLSFENAVKVDNITHTEFATSANIIKHESSGNKEESLWIAHAANNASGLKDVGGKHTSMYSQLMDSNYSTTPSSARTPLKTSDNSSAANNARAAVLDVMSGGADPTGGAVLWDGTDFLAWGTDHNKFKEYGLITIDSEHLSTFIDAQKAVYGDSVKYGDNKYTLPHKVFTTSALYGDRTGGLMRGGSRGGVWDAGFMKGGKGKYYNLQSTGTKGTSIFWKATAK